VEGHDKKIPALHAERVLPHFLIRSGVTVHIHLSQSAKTIDRIMTDRTIKGLKHYYKFQSSYKPRCTQNKIIEMHSDGIVTISPRQMSDCYAICKLSVFVLK